MTIVMTILGSDNSKQRRRDRRAAERELAAQQRGPRSSKIEKAISLPPLRCKESERATLSLGKRKSFDTVRAGATHIVNARQKMRGKSIPLI